jgi:hypothetical protein
MHQMLRKGLLLGLVFSLMTPVIYTRGGQLTQSLAAEDVSSSVSTALDPHFQEYELDPLLPPWPKTLAEGGIESPLVVDVDGDGQAEVVVVSSDVGIVHVFRPDGSYLPGWPVVSGVTFGTVAAADLTGDGKLEIVLGSQLNQGGDIYSYLNVYRSDGTPLPGWPKDMGEHHLTTPVLGDVDGDGQMEVVVSTHFSSTSFEAGIFIYRMDGSSLPGWPKIFHNNYAISDPWTGGPVLGDMNGDGKLEVALSLFDGRVYVWNSVGKVVPNWPRTVNPGLPENERVISSLAMGDLDNDGSLDLVAVGKYMEVHAWRTNGKLLRGFPYTLSEKIIHLSPPALGDLDGDGRLEIVFRATNDFIHVVRFNGRALTGWPAYLPGSPFYVMEDQPLIADVTGDGNLNVILHNSYGGIAAFHQDGFKVSEWFIPSIYPGLRTLALGDLTGDGKRELLSISLNKLYIWRVNSPVGGQPWAVYKGNPARTGQYGLLVEAQPPQPTPVTPDPTPSTPVPSPTATVMPTPTTTPSPTQRPLLKLYLPLGLRP